ncbi:ribosomal large subunit pseudouridine synthase A [Escherichia coli]|nr:ribosomal large subunit pseudouridine synthase A [Escherichia coli]
MGMGKLQSTAGTRLVILYQDDHIMVVNKPSGCCLCRVVWKSTKIA